MTKHVVRLPVPELGINSRKMANQIYTVTAWIVILYYSRIVLVCFYVLLFAYFIIQHIHTVLCQMFALFAVCIYTGTPRKEADSAASQTG